MTTTSFTTMEWQAIEPILFNNWKHHAGALRIEIAQVINQGPSALKALGENLKQVGARLMDLYTGELTPRVITESLIQQMKRQGIFKRAAFEEWICKNGEYGVLTLEDDSCWVLRLATDQERFMHLHPGRWTPHTVRARANVLKTAILVLAHVGIVGGDPFDVSVVNQVRREHLDLSPIPQALDANEGLGEMIALLSRQ